MVGFACSDICPVDDLWLEDCAFYECNIEAINCLRFAANR
jgi:hypothetical protein